MKRLLLALLLSVSLLAGTANASKYGNGSSSASSSSSSPSHSHYGGGTSSGTGTHSNSSSSIGTKPKSSYNSFDSSAASDKHKDDSQAAFQKSQKPAYTPSAASPTYYTKPVYQTPTGATRTVDTSSQHYAYLKGRLDESHYQQRPTRYQSFYGSRYSYYYSRPATYYNDGYASSFWWYLRDQNYQTQGLYAYNHRYDMDPRRYNDLLLIAGVASEVAYLEATNAPRSSTWCPNGMDYDLMYSDSYVSNVHDYAAASGQPVVYVSGGTHYVRDFFGFIVFAIAIIVLLAVVSVVFRERND